MTHARIRVQPRRLLWGLLAADFLLITLHVLSIWSLPGTAGSGYLMSPLFRIDLDRGIPEVFQYLKLAGIVGLLGVTWHRYRYLSAAAWAVVFSYILLDDALSLHERYGRTLANTLTLSSAYGVRAQDLGELLVWAAVGLALGTLVIYAYVVGSHAARSYAHRLTVLFGALAFFGVVVDALHSALFSLTLTHLLGQGSEAAETGIAPLAAATAGLLQLPPGASWTVVFITVAALALPVLSAAPAFLATAADVLYNAMLFNTAFTLLEDGGEMIVVSFILHYCASALASSKRL